MVRKGFDIPDMKRRICILSLALIFLNLVIWGLVYADINKDLNGFAISKTIINLKGKPNESLENTFEIRNHTGNDARVKIEVRDFELKDNTILYKQDVPDNWSVAKWTTMGNEELILGAGKTEKVSLHVEIPQDAEMGEHMALVAVQFMPSHGKGNVKVATEILPVLYVGVTDQDGNMPINKVWVLKNFTADQLNGGNLYFQVMNQGNVHLESSGSVIVKNLMTGSEKTIDIPRVNLLPNHEKTIQVDAKPQDYIGIYKVKAQFSMDESERIEEKETMFYIIPWAPVVVLIVFLLMVVIGIKVYLSNLKKRIIREARNQIGKGEDIN